MIEVAGRRPALTVAVGLGLAVAGVGYAAHSLAIQTSKLHLLPTDQPYARTFRAHVEDFGELEDIVVAVRGRSVEEAAAYAERLVGMLRTGPIAFERAAYRVDVAALGGRALLFLPLERLRALRDRLVDAEDLLRAFAARPALDALLHGLNEQVAAGFVSQVFDLGLREPADPAAGRFLADLLAEMERRVEGGAGGGRPPWAALLGGDGGPGERGYFLAADRSLLFVLVRRAGRHGTFSDERATIELIRARLAALRAEFPAVEAGVTGAPALYNDELTVAFADSELATALAFGLTLALLLVVFRRVARPLLMLLALAVSLAWALGVTTLTVGHLTIFSVMFMSIVIGIGIDYGIYVLFRYEEERALGADLTTALATTAERNGPAIVLSACAAAGTFYVLAVTDFRGVREFGFISGTAILLACLAMLTVFPALLVLADRGRVAGGPPPLSDRQDVPLVQTIVRWPWTVVLAASLLAGVALGLGPKLDLDYNVLNLQAHGTESVEWEHRILRTTGRSGFPAVATAGSLDELARRQAAFARLPSVSQVESVLTLLPDRQPEKLALLASLAPTVRSVRVGPPPPLGLDRVRAELGTLRRRLALAGVAGRAADPTVAALRARVESLLARVGGPARQRAAAALADFQRDLARELAEGVATLERAVTASPVGVDDLPEEIRRKFVGRSGRFLLEIHPRVNVWARAGATAFVGDLRSVDPEVTGQAIIAYESIALMERAYQQGTVYALGLVAALAFAVIRRPGATWLAMMPLVLGAVWGLGAMRALGHTFNLANVWGIPLIIGAAAEFGLLIVFRALEAGQHGGPLFARSTVLGVFLSGLTTIAGFGSLLVAHHQGIWSLGFLLMVGTVASLVAALIVLPVMIQAGVGAGRVSGSR